MSRKSGVKNTDSPIMRKIKTPVTRCSATPQNSGFSPGAVESRSLKGQRSHSSIVIFSEPLF